MNSVDTVVVGAGHAGLAMSYCLKERGVEHVVLERGDVGQRWRDERWDSITLLTPNWATELPGFHYDGDDPNGFEGRDGYVSYLERYARSFGTPIQNHTTVARLTATARGTYLLDTSKGPLEARSVVAATGPFHVPVFPEARDAVPSDVLQIHSNEYRRPAQLPDGPVLVAGSGNSGLQIVEELAASGRRVFASIGRLRSAPRRYRGRDIVGWMIDLGALDTRVEEASPDVRKIPPPLLTGVGGGHDLNLKQMSDRGAIFLGRLAGGRNGRLFFSDDVNDTLRASAAAYRDFRTRVDRFVSERGLNAPEDQTPCADADLIPVVTAPLTELDLGKERIRSIVWATGFRVAYDWIDVPVFGPSGEPVHQAGATASPGLYFLGLRWLTKYKSFFIYGVGEDAQRLAQRIALERHGRIPRHAG
jgi:putative flavoprotein involved in K+ transport